MVGTTVKKVTGLGRSACVAELEDSVASEMEDVEAEGAVELDADSGDPLVTRNGVAKRCHTAVALKGNRNSIVLPEYNGVRSAFTVPWMWWSGRTWRR